MENEESVKKTANEHSLTPKRLSNPDAMDCSDIQEDSCHDLTAKLQNIAEDENCLMNSTDEDGKPKKVQKVNPTCLDKGPT